MPNVDFIARTTWSLVFLDFVLLSVVRAVLWPLPQSKAEIIENISLTSLAI